MTGRERFLITLANGKADRLPCQVHSFMKYFLIKNRLFTNLNAHKYFDMDPVLYVSPKYIYADDAFNNWKQVKKFKSLKNGTFSYTNKIITPKGTLKKECSFNVYTSWDTEPLIKTEADFELFKEFFPVPIKADWTRVIKAKDKIGDNGIVRSVSFHYGQSGAFQSLATMMDTETLIYKAYDEPEWVHYALEIINNKNIEAVINAGKIECDLVETGGGAGSSTVISPSMHEEFCLPYDKLLHKAIKDNGAMVSYHLCGGLMPLLEMVEKNGADALETMTPPSMGGDCDIAEANRRVGKKLAFIGGLDQNMCFEKGTPERVEKTVRELFEKNPDGGYICSPSDHFFFGSKENIKAFSRACKECIY